MSKKGEEGIIKKGIIGEDVIGMLLLNFATDMVEASNGMSDELKGAIFTALVTSIISIIGFIATNISMKKNFANELKRQRDNIALEKMSTMPYEVLALMDEMLESGKIKNEIQKKKKYGTRF